MTTTYGTIPTSTHPHDSISRATLQIQSHLDTCRPWSQLLSFSTLSFPRAFSTASSRATTNISYFRANYALVILATLFLSLVTHPISLIIFAVLITAWVLLYFIRDAPLVILGRVVDDLIVLIVLSFATLLFLFVSGVENNIVVGVVVGVVVVLVHAAFREIDDLRVDGAEFEDQRVGFSGDRLPLKHTASSGYSS